MRTDKDKAKLLLSLVVLGMVAATFGFYMYVAQKGGIDREALMLGIPLIGLLLITAAFIKQGWDSVKHGMPLKDERIKRAGDKAGALTYYILIYVLLGLGMFEDAIGFERASQATGLAILISAIIFMSLFMYFSKKPDLK